MDIKKVSSISLDELMDQQEEQEEAREEDFPESSTSDNPYQTKKADRFFLPVLHLNKEDFWGSKPISERKHFTGDVAVKTCLSNCCGYEGLKSACCTLDPWDLEHILGPIDEKWIVKILSFFRKKGMFLTRSDIVIDYEEGRVIGRTHFNGHAIFEQKTSYPMLRIQVNGPRWVCKFLNPHNGKCNIYESRPSMCRDYLCQYVKTNFLVKTKKNPNQWKKLR